MDHVSVYTACVGFRDPRDELHFHAPVSRRPETTAKVYERGDAKDRREDRAECSTYNKKARHLAHAHYDAQERALQPIVYGHPLLCADASVVPLTRQAGRFGAARIVPVREVFHGPQHFRARAHGVNDLL